MSTNWIKIFVNEYLQLYDFYMILIMIRPKNVNEDLLLSITENCETIIEQTHRKAAETLEFKITKSRETFHFNPPISIEGSRTIGSTDLEV